VHLRDNIVNLNHTWFNSQLTSRRIVVSSKIVDVIVVVHGWVALWFRTQSTCVPFQWQHFTFVRDCLHIIFINMRRLKKCPLDIKISANQNIFPVLPAACYSVCSLKIS
jgi:hypothetical protein